MDFQETYLFDTIPFPEQVGTIHSFLFLFEINEIGDEAEKMCRDNTRVVSRLVQWIFLLNHYLKPTYLFCKIYVDVSKGLDIFVVVIPRKHVMNPFLMLDFSLLTYNQRKESVIKRRSFILSLTKKKI